MILIAAKDIRWYGKKEEKKNNLRMKKWKLDYTLNRETNINCSIKILAGHKTGNQQTKKNFAKKIFKNEPIWENSDYTQRINLLVSEFNEQKGKLNRKREKQ